jgi:hypothetical protein
VSEPRSAAAVGAEFPYDSSTMCYIEVGADGTVLQGVDAAAYRRAVVGQSRLYAVWPGKWRSDLFAVDDLDQLARGLGFVYDAQRTGLADHEHQVTWSVSPYATPNPRSPYVGIQVQLLCGCTIRDLRAFADQMRKQCGWDIATSGGWGSSTADGTTTYSMRARRKGLAS